MMGLERSVSARWLRWELPLLCLLGGVFFCGTPLVLGYMGLSWDALNHHIYLGWTAQSPRFDRDYLAASTQSYQFPYLYWPVYQLAISGVSGPIAGAILNSVYVLAVPAVWLLVSKLLPGASWYHVLMRMCGSVLAFATGALLALLDATSNDLVAAIPYLWSVTAAFLAAAPFELSDRPRKGFVALSGFFLGLSVAFKFSNGPLAFVLPMMWWMTSRTWGRSTMMVLLGGSMTIFATLLVYGPWGYLLWREFGNPIFPLYDHVFVPIRNWSGWER